MNGTPHLAWALGAVPGEDVSPDVEPYKPEAAERIAAHLFRLADQPLGSDTATPAAARVREALALILEGARFMLAFQEHRAIDVATRLPSRWREELATLRHDRRRFAEVIRSRDIRAVLRLALISDPGLEERAGPRWLHCLRDDHRMLRRVIDKALGSPWLVPKTGRSDRYDRVILAEAVGEAYSLLTGKGFKRRVTVGSRQKAGGRPTGPKIELLRICLKPLDPHVTDETAAELIRAVQRQSTPPLK